MIVRMWRAFCALVLATALASAVHLFVFSYLAHVRIEAVFSSSNVRYWLVPCLPASVAVAIWLTFDGKPDVRRAGVVVMATTTVHTAALVYLVSQMAHSLDQAFATIQFLPIVAGAVYAFVGYGISKRIVPVN